MDTHRFEGQTIVVTGGSKGIGKATAIRFAEEGAEHIVITTSRNTEETNRTMKIIEELGSKVTTIMCDMANEESVKNFFTEIEKTVGKIHHIIHSAGISPNTPFMEQTSAEWNQVLATNLTGSFLVCKYGAEVMHNIGSITLISSTNGINSNAPYSSHYDASKAGMIILAKDAAEELRARNIRVNTVAPGWIDTPMNDTLPPGEKEKETTKIFAGRFADPSEIASVCAFMASKDASYINGTTLMVDGGYRG